jgi:NADH:ubiquinone oxidoreductase subunit 5 (subunit L)/multisubunit Na+/H+ antiporter MnhA subunit
MLELAWLIPAFPLLAACGLALDRTLRGHRGEAAERGTARLALGAAWLSFLLALLLGLQALWQGPPGQVRFGGTWLASGELRVDLAFTLDGLGLALLVLAATLCLLTLRFAVNYLHREEGFQRFFMVLLLFMGAMELILMAGNAVLAFMGWELAGLASYLLIAYNFERPVASANANRAFITNRIGDAGFLLGIFFAFQWLGGSDWLLIAERAPNLPPLQADLMALAFLVAALAKSAQLPFAPWIGRALEGPTPSSAIFYGALMVHAGVYLLIRLESLLAQVPAVAALVAFIGVLTALYGWLGGMARTDVKSALMFSTTAQVGLMFLWIGLGWTTWASWHLALHAIWRAWQFLQAPALMHRASRPARLVPAWLGRRRWLHQAVLQGFWLDDLADAFLVRPTRAMARDVQDLDERVLSRIVGLPGDAAGLSDLGGLATGEGGWLRPSEERIVQGRGLLGRSLAGVAALLYWFEERLVLRGGGEGLLTAIQRLAHLANQVEGLLARPRYLFLMILATLGVIL